VSRTFLKESNQNKDRNKGTMINTIRICEIQDELHKIKIEQEEADECFCKLKREEEQIYEDLSNCLRRLSLDFEACHYDAQLSNLVEEKYRLLLTAIRNCGDSIDELHEDHKKTISMCDSKIDDLEQEQQLLEVIPI